MPQVSPLDRLWALGRILGGDYLAGRRYAYLAHHRETHDGCRRRYEAARDVLDRAATLCLQMVDLMVVIEEQPRSSRGLDAAIDGLGVLHAHFVATWPDYAETPLPR